MSRGYCSNCKIFFDNGTMCGKCGSRLTLVQDTPSSQMTQNYIISDNYSQTQPNNTRIQNNGTNTKGKFLDNFRNLKSIDKFTLIGLVFLFLYNLIGLIVSLSLAEKIIRANQRFLVKINVSHFWLWLLIIINLVLLAGAVFLRKNKSVLCVVGQGLVWLSMLIVSFSSMDISELNLDDMEIAWENGVVSTFGMSTEVSQVLGVVSFSLSHLFVIYLWVAALIFVSIGSFTNVRDR